MSNTEISDEVKQTIQNAIFESFNKGIEISAQTLEILVDVSIEAGQLTDDQKKYWSGVTSLIRQNKKRIVENGSENINVEGNQREREVDVREGSDSGE